MNASSNRQVAHGTHRGTTNAVLVAFSVGVVLLASGCGGGDEGDSRPTAEAINASLAGTNLAADMTTTEVQCFAQQLHDGNLSSPILSKLVTGTDGNLTDSELIAFDAAATSAASDCGATYVSPRS